MMYGYPYGGYSPQTRPVPQPGMNPNYQAQTRFVVQPVACEDEARAIPTDFSGNIMLLPDLTHGKIYCKALNMADGSALFTTFEAPQPPAPAPVEWATSKALDELRAELADVRAMIEKPARKKEAKGDEQ